MCILRAQPCAIGQIFAVYAGCVNGPERIAVGTGVREGNRCFVSSYFCSFGQSVIYLKRSKSGIFPLLIEQSYYFLSVISIISAILIHNTGFLV